MKLKIAGLAVAVLTLMAVIALFRGTVRGQTLRDQPLMEFRTQLLGGTEIGVTVRDVDEADVKREKLGVPGGGSVGAVVDDVRRDSPAANAGIRAGDVIVSFDGEKVRSARHFARLSDETQAGRQVETTVVRNGERLTLKVTPEPARFRSLRDLGERMGDSLALHFPRLADRFERFHGYSGELGPVVRGTRGRLGVGVQDLTRQLGEYFGTADGVLVTEVDEDTPAKAAGLKAGDVITKINGGFVRSTDDLRRRLGDASGETKITIFRERKALTLTANLR